METTTREQPRLLRTPAPTPTRPVVPAAGPAWFSSVMGTGILATLLGQQSSGRPVVLVAAVLLLVVAVLLLVGLTFAFTARIAADRTALTSTVTDPAAVPLWGTVSMGLLAVGAAVLTVAPLVHPSALTAAVRVDAVLWTLGTVVGLVTALGFTAVLVRSEAGAPTPVWGLPVVPPMVSATTGAALLPHVTAELGRVALLAVVVGCFFLSLGIGLVVYAVAYHHHWRISAIPVAASASIWIPLGMVGQSAAASMMIATHAGTVVDAAALPALSDLAEAYAFAMLLLSVPVVAVAVRVTVRGFRAGMPFSPGWWALTFPIGTLALGAHLLAGSTGLGWVEAVARLCLVTLVGTWTFCTVATVRTIVRVRRSHGTVAA
ncbi:MAG: TDT family transporter [Terracoccus sp.]